MDVLLDHHLLRPHPAVPPDAVSAVTCGLSWRRAGDCVIDFIVAEPAEALSLPRAVRAARAEGLWQTTCFELFLKRPGEDGYLEFNFSPSGQWAAWTFEGYRRGRADLDMAAPIITTADPERYALAAEERGLALGLDPEVARILAQATAPEEGTVSQFALSVALSDPVLATQGPWLASLSAVIEEAHGAQSYWALVHPSDKPDFHHPDSFVLELP